MNKRIGRGIIALLALIIYIVYMVFLLWITGKHLALIVPNIEIDTILYRIFGTILVLTLIKTSKNYSYALPWIIIILLFPIVGTILFFVLRKK